MGSLSGSPFTSDFALAHFDLPLPPAGLSPFDSADSPRLDLRSLSDFAPLGLDLDDDDFLPDLSPRSFSRIPAGAVASSGVSTCSILCFT